MGICYSSNYFDHPISYIVYYYLGDSVRLLRLDSIVAVGYLAHSIDDYFPDSVTETFVALYFLARKWRSVGDR